jgi:hypothetical protein
MKKKKKNEEKEKEKKEEEEKEKEEEEEELGRFQLMQQQGLRRWPLLRCENLLQREAFRRGHSLSCYCSVGSFLL